jgi:CubicO group peptidase (beta-lactamase class C family)
MIASPRILPPLPSTLPSASLVVRQHGRLVHAEAHGLACLDPSRPVGRDRVYDLASLTKALVTGPVAAALANAGVLDVSAPVAGVLPDVDPRITAWQLLCHTSGLPAWAPLHDQGDRRAVLAAARATPPEHEPGTTHTYSDIGFLVLLDLLETLTGHGLDALFRELVSGPAGVRGLSWGHPDAAATEATADRGLLQGTVHDANAAAMGGVSSHAGLFGSARTVARLAERLALGDVPGVSETLRTWWATPSVGPHRGGWDTPTRGAYTSTGAHFPDDAVGHLGYTGTSVWVVPSRSLVVALLTNRVHPADDGLDDIRSLRPAVHDAVWARFGETP